MSETQKILLKKAQVGDIGAFEQLISDNQRKIYNLCYRIMGNAQDAEDMAQEAMLKAWRSLNKFRGTSLFSTWLYSIAVNTCRDALRKRKASYISIEDMKEHGRDVSSPGQPMQERSASIQLIKSVLNQLPPNMKAIMVLRDVEDYSYEQISQILDCSIGTVRSRLHRARLKFAQIYADTEQSGSILRHNDVRRASK